MSEIVSRVHVDPNDRRYTFERIQDVEPVLERNKVLSATPQKSDWGRHVASIPCIFVEKWLNEFYERSGRFLRFPSREFDEEIAEPKLRDPENKWMLVGGPDRYQSVKWPSTTM